MRLMGAPVSTARVTIWNHGEGMLEGLRESGSVGREEPGLRARAGVMRKGWLPIVGAVLALSLAGCPESATYDFPGPYRVEQFAFRLSDSSEASVFHPSREHHVEGAPLIVFSSGWNQLRKAYFGYATHLSEWGYVAVVRFYPSLGASGFGDAFLDEHVGQVFEIMDWCAEQNLSPESPLYGMVDASNVGTAGHSMGVVVSVLAALDDDRINAVVGLDGNYADAETDQRMPNPIERDPAMLFLNGGIGAWCTRTPFALYHFYDVVNPPAMDVVVVGSDHMDFMENDCGFLCEAGNVVCPQGTADEQQVRDLAARYMIAWFNVYLRDQPEFELYFNGTFSAQDEANGRVIIRRKMTAEMPAER